MNDEVSLLIQDRLEKAVNYNRWIFETVRPYLGRRILDVGCSVGNITRLFVEHGVDLVIGVDANARAIERINRTLGPSGCFRGLCLDAAELDPAAFADEKIDTISCLNVLEHIRDDLRLLQSFYVTLVSSGRLILLVPALQVLYGSMDIADHHYRRYSRQGLSDLIRRAGFQVDRVFYMNFVGVVGWLLNGRLFKRRLIPEKQLQAFDRIVPLLRRMEGLVPPPIGQSLIGIGVKRDGDDPLG